MADQLSLLAQPKPKGPNLVYFDLETARSADEVGGWNNIRGMGMACAVCFDSHDGQFHVYEEKEVPALVGHLERADLVVGFNHVSFDYEVLMGYTVLDLRDCTRNLDLMVDLEKTLQHRPKLDAVAGETLGESKTAVGTDAIKWWQEGKIMAIAEYCCFDVKVTKLVHEYGAKNGLVKYRNRFNQSIEIPVDWSLPE